MNAPQSETWLMKGVIPYVGLDDPDAAIAFYARAFGARVLGDIARDEAGLIMNASVEINGGVIMLMHAMQEGGGRIPQRFGTAHLQLVVSDGQGWWDRAVAAGCTITMAFGPQFWGDRFGALVDPFGQPWAINEPNAAAIAASQALPEAPFTLAIDRVLAAPRWAVWRAWTEAEHLKAWYCPKPWRVAEAELDVRPGGRFDTVFAGPEGERMPNSGMFLAVEPLRRLTFTDAYRADFAPTGSHFMTGFVDLTDAPGGGTRMLWGARHANAEDHEKHRSMGFETGWNAAADQLEAEAKAIAAEAA